ncbi:hypothetical protein KM295_16115 [Natronomonas sp. F2-12]|jgi:hypothetical protein|uniref:Uncharacterized protein n=1 Tax=Natronomonas aquatica TaxID=2841590 RepID=A0A9R1CWD7_9EURY|nr:hypothetical protein [Natronomonas aquatica]MCQ4334977.1 hypothetical protein [Natronomonas aquatica]
MFVRNPAVTEWTLADLRRVGDPSAVFGGDAVCCSNWDSIPGLEGAFRRLCETDLPRVPFVFDPGDGRTALGVHRGDTDRSAAIREAAGSTAAVMHARD